MPKRIGPRELIETLDETVSARRNAGKRNC
jgi:hypothetical protein